VFLIFECSLERKSALIFEMGEHGDVIARIPWGPVELWGPTEGSVPSIEEGFEVAPEDVAFLLEQRSRCMKNACSKEAIVALRPGVRPLAVPAAYQGDDYSLALSRSLRIASDLEKPWVSVYGGKITGCTEAATQVLRKLRAFLPERRGPAPHAARGAVEMETASFPGLADPVATAAWCRDHELCYTLDDYLRRRTNIAQWVRRCGLGRNDENREHLRAISRELSNGDAARADRALERYEAEIVGRFDGLLAEV
jgi:hypothetical protein